MKRKISSILAVVMSISLCFGCGKKEMTEEKDSQNTEQIEQSTQIETELVTEKKITATDVEELIQGTLKEGLTGDSITEIEELYSKLTEIDKKQVSSYTTYQERKKTYYIGQYTEEITKYIKSIGKFQYEIDEFDDSISIAPISPNSSQTIKEDGYAMAQMPVLVVSFNDEGKPSPYLWCFWYYFSAHFLDVYSISDQELILLASNSSRVNLKLTYVDVTCDDTNKSEFSIHINESNCDKILDIMKNTEVKARINKLNNQSVYPQVVLDDVCKDNITNLINLYKEIINMLSR